ncbi:amidohydrolase [Desulfohalobiaceae bacterium Ax17]|uniref:amidohydrolase n=1 Tax=Desulfovulcanus ferrireducens TaxID=2831190 RepID=UPI00207BC999|nr:amidohydrolase [Desulfovulcanus ferrireducens]MBT8762671.1 amidohydrolase [Desulfovulcanus ferrireducens]
MTILIKNILLDDKQVDIYIRQNRFEKIGTNLNEQADVLIDGQDKAILPSFINSHTHAAMTLLRGYADDLELHTWLTKYIWPFEQNLTQEDVYLGTKLACLEMIKSGTTFFSDMYWYMPGTLQAVEDMGLRAALSSVFIDFNDPKKAKKFRKRTREFFAEHTDTERIIFTLGPHAIYTVSKESLIWLKEFAQEKNLLIHIHIAETKKEVDDCLNEHGLTPVRYLEKIGFLGPNIISCHNIWVDEEEMDILAKHEVKIVHNPVSNMKLCSGIFPYAKLKERDLCIGLGTDGCASNNNLDMLEEMKVATLLAKISSNDPTNFTAKEAFDCATINGAKIFGLDIGEIAPGKLADCILVDLNHPQLVPNHNLISNMVYAASGECVHTTICNGQILMHDRQVPGEKELIAEVKDRISKKLRK